MTPPIKTLLTHLERLHDYVEQGIELMPDNALQTKWKADTIKIWNAIIQNTNELNGEYTITYPTDNPAFIEKWQQWKAYLAEQHKTHINYYMELNGLETLAQMCDHDFDKAIEYITTSIANGYDKIYPNEYKRPKPQTNTQEDGDLI